MERVSLKYVNSIFRSYRFLTTIGLSVCAVLLSDLLSPVQCSAINGTIVLQDAVADSLTHTIETHITSIINQLETNDLSPVQAAFTEEGFTSATALLDRVPMRNTRAVHETRLLRLPTHAGYEVRDIRVQVENGATPGNPYHFLVFTLANDGRVEGVRFAMEKLLYTNLVREGQELRDFVERQHVIQFVELFRTAYNRRDLEYIERIFSDDALIIVGQVVQVAPDLPGQDSRLSNSTIGHERIEFIRRSKDEYLNALKEIFEKNDFLNVKFDSLRVVRDHRDSALYGVELKQYWKSSSYSDEGYIFLLLDFVDENLPILHVRSWQTRRFEDGSLLSLQDFEVIRVGNP